MWVERQETHAGGKGLDVEHEGTAAEHVECEQSHVISLTDQYYK